MTLETSKNLGGIGAILMFIGIFPIVSTYGIVELVGAILILVGLRGFASNFKEDGIFNNALYGVIAAIVGVVAAVAIAIAIVLPNVTGLLETLYPGWNGDWTTLSQFANQTPNTANLNPSDVLPFLSAAIVVLVIVWVVSIVAAFLIRRSLKLTAAKTGTGLFSTAGTVLLIGAGLTIIFIGFILIWIAALVLAIAFFTTKQPVEQPPAAAVTTTSPPMSPTPV